MTTTRHEAAQLVADAVSDEPKFAARVWQGGDVIRVYFSEWNAKRNQKGAELGYCEIALDGTVEWKVTGYKVQRLGEEALKGVEIAPAQPAAGIGRFTAAQIARAAKEGSLRSLLSDEEIAAAKDAGLISVSDAMNQDF